MPFTGKATYSAGADLPEIAEDVSDIISVVSPWETPLLDHLGDPARAARSTVHEWLEDTLLPNTDALNQTTFTPSPTAATALTVGNGGRFQIGDQVRPGDSAEVMLVTLVAANVITVVRGYGGTTPATLANGMRLLILGNAALEGDDRRSAQSKTGIRAANPESCRAQQTAGGVWLVRAMPPAGDPGFAGPGRGGLPRDVQIGVAACPRRPPKASRGQSPDSIETRLPLPMVTRSSLSGMSSPISLT